MAELMTVDLRGRIPGGASLEFLKAQMNRSMATPFVHIRYALDGVEQTNGLRMDLDKKTIFDRLGNPARDTIIEHATLPIAGLLTPIASVRDSMIYTPDSYLGPYAFLREINDLHYFRRFSPEEIADIFGFDVDDVRKVTQLVEPNARLLQSYRSEDSTSPR